MLRHLKMWGPVARVEAGVTLMAGLVLGTWAVVTVPPASARIELGSSLSLVGLYLIYAAPLYLVASGLITQQIRANLGGLSPGVHITRRHAIVAMWPFMVGILLVHVVQMVLSVVVTYSSAANVMTSVDLWFPLSQILLLATLLAAGVAIGTWTKNPLIPPLAGLGLVALSFMAPNPRTRDFFAPGNGTPSTIFLQTSLEQMMMRVGVLAAVLLCLLAFTRSGFAARFLCHLLASASVVGAVALVLSPVHWSNVRTDITYSCQESAPQVCSPAVMASWAASRVVVPLQKAYRAVTPEWRARLPEQVKLGTGGAVPAAVRSQSIF